jgi:hypothetical protein
MLETEIPAEERDYVVLKPIGHVAYVSAVVNFKAVFDAVVVEDLVELDHDVKGAKHVGMLHANPKGAITAHGMADKAAGGASKSP